MRNGDSGMLPAEPSAHADEDERIWVIIDRDCKLSRPQSPILVAFDMVLGQTLPL